MKLLFLYIIKLYWILIPPHKRRICIFHTSCSNHVFNTTKKDGLNQGIKELIFRFKNCNSKFDIVVDYTTGKKKMILKSGTIIAEEQIANRLR